MYHLMERISFRIQQEELFRHYCHRIKIAKGTKNIQISYPNNQPSATVGNNEFKDFVNTQFQNGKLILDADSLENTLESIRFKQWKWVDYEGDGDMAIIVGMDSWGEYGWDNAYDEKGK